MNVISTLPQAAMVIPGAKRRAVAGKLHIILLLSCICVCNFLPANKCSMRSDCGAGSAGGDWRGAGVVPKAGFGCSELCERKTKTER